MRRYEAVYVSIPKAACTSLKWMVADIQGESAERFHGSLSREVARSTTIHRRRLWRRTPMLHRLPDDVLAEISPENGWFVFAVVRHPSTRLWSAWQSKLLLREPRWVDRFGAEPWMPRVPESTEQIVEDFRRFVLAIADDPAQPVLRDRHFQPQGRLLTPERTPYTRVYKTAEIPELLEDLGAHLRAHGWTGALRLPATNETPLRPLASMFTPEVRAAVERVYREDFERFGYPSSEPDKVEPGAEYSPSTVNEIGRLVERAERIGDLSRRAQRLAGERKQLQDEVKQLRARVNGRGRRPRALLKALVGR
jgi:hypothetical protein